MQVKFYSKKSQKSVKCICTQNRLDNTSEKHHWQLHRDITSVLTEVMSLSAPCICRLKSEIRLDEQGLWESIHRFLILLKSGLQLGHFNKLSKLFICSSCWPLARWISVPVSCCLQRVFFQDYLLFSSIHLPISYNKLSYLGWRKASLQHNAATL